MIYRNGLSEIKDVIVAADPLVEYQRVHLTCRTQYAELHSEQEQKAYTNNTKPVYHIPVEQTVRFSLTRFEPPGKLSILNA